MFSIDNWKKSLIKKTKIFDKCNSLFEVEFDRKKRNELVKINLYEVGDKLNRKLKNSENSPYIIRLHKYYRGVPSRYDICLTVSEFEFLKQTLFTKHETGVYTKEDLNIILKIMNNGIRIENGESVVTLDTNFTCSFYSLLTIFSYIMSKPISNRVMTYRILFCILALSERWNEYTVQKYQEYMEKDKMNPPIEFVNYLVELTKEMDKKKIMEIHGKWTKILNNDENKLNLDEDFHDQMWHFLCLRDELTKSLYLLMSFVDFRDTVE